MSITIVASLSRNGVIGKHNSLPWHIPEELKHFRRVTTGGTLVMGRKTFESIGKPLPDRNTIVLTSDRNWSFEGVDVIHDFDDVLTMSEYVDLFIVGGGSVYQQFVDYADIMILSVIDMEIDGDTFFPTIDDDWELYSSDDFEQYTVKEYRK